LDAFQAIDAISASFFGLLGIWAAVDRRHWFLRFSVLTGILLFALFLPAYEVVIEFSVEMIIIIAAVSLLRRRDDWKPRLSLETALLSMVVVAIGAGVLGRSPEFDGATWFQLANTGCRTAVVALWSLWIAFGKTRLWRRFVLGVVMIVPILGGMYLGDAVLNGIQQWQRGQEFWSACLKYFQWESLPGWLSWYVPRVVLGQFILLSILTAARVSGWFAPVTTAEAASSRSAGRLIARLSLGTLLIAVTTPLVYLFYCLMTAIPLPGIHPPSPNGYDDFIAAGEKAAAWWRMARPRGTPNKAESERYFNDLQPVADRVAEGLKKQCLAWPRELTAHGVGNRDFEALERLADVLTLRLRYLFYYGDTSELTDAAVDTLRFSQEGCRGVGETGSFPEQCESSATYCIGSRLGQLSSADCLRLIKVLTTFDENRESFELKRQRQRIIDQHRGWQVHAEQILSAWSGRKQDDNYAGWTVAETRLLIANLAAQAFFLDKRRAPKSLDELVPEYLPAVPFDAYAQQPLHYQYCGYSFAIYSVGPDEDDDQGRGWTPDPTSNDYDIVVRGPSYPVVWNNLIRAASIISERAVQAYRTR
jgi:hypothetical protein